MNRSLETRVDRLEEYRGTQGPLGDLPDSELLILIAKHAHELDQSFVEEFDEEERRTAAYNQRPDVAKSIAANIASGWAAADVPLRTNFRWPYLLHNAEWHERQYPPRAWR